jgi:hypothetical protein
MGWLDSLFGVPNAPHTWGGGGGGNSNQFNYRGSRMDTDDLRMRGMGEHALQPNFRGQGRLWQLWQQYNPQGPGYVPPEPGPAQVQSPYAPPEGPPAQMPQPPMMGFNPQPAPPKFGQPPPSFQPMRTLPPSKGVIRK